MWALSPSFTESPTYPRVSIVPHLSAHYPTPQSGGRQHKGSHSRADITPSSPTTAASLLLASSQGQIHIQLLTPSLHDLTNGPYLPFVSWSCRNSFRWKHEPSLQLWGLDGGGVVWCVCLSSGRGWCGVCVSSSQRLQRYI